LILNHYYLIYILLVLFINYVNMALVHINGIEHFKNEVVDYDWIVVVDFYADWCGPCRMLWPIMEELSTLYPDKPVKIVKVNVDENMELAWQFGIQWIPAVFIVKQWQIVANMVWLHPLADYQQKIDELLQDLQPKEEWWKVVDFESKQESNDEENSDYSQAA
jgi:thioredoxin 1